MMCLKWKESEPSIVMKNMQEILNASKWIFSYLHYSEPAPTQTLAPKPVVNENERTNKLQSSPASISCVSELLHIWPMFILNSVQCVIVFAVTYNIYARKMEKFLWCIILVLFSVLAVQSQEDCLPCDKERVSNNGS